MVDPNTRQGKRTPVTLKIKFKSETIEQFIERYAVDVSQGGIFIRTKEPLAVGTQMKFEFQLRDASPLIAGEGTVVWTRENDPSRPAIAPGMGVRFDRLGDGSQNVLERILAEKAKQAPARGANDGPTKPPMFTDTPTRVAPAPVQEALGVRGRKDSEQTPLPNPMSFHSDADDFDARAFEEATKVRSLDDLALQSAGLGGEGEGEGEPNQGEVGDTTNQTQVMPPDELALRRSAGRDVAADPDAPLGESPDEGPIGVAKQTQPDRDSAPGLPSPPETGRQPRMLDATPSPRSEARPSQPPVTAPAEDPNVRTKPGHEPARVATAARRPSAPEQAAVQSAVAKEMSRPVAPKRPSSAPIVIGVLVVVAAAMAAVWWFVLRDDLAKDNTTSANTGVTGSATGGNTGAIKTGSDNGSATGSGSAAPAVDTAKAPVVDTVIASSVAKGATVEVVGTDQTGPAPLTAKLEKDKPYKARVHAPGFQVAELDIKGGQDKVTATLEPKPRVIVVGSTPAGAAIYIDGSDTQKVTPSEVTLSPSQAARPKVRVVLRRPGFRPIDQAVDAAAFKDEDARMAAKIDAKLQPMSRPTGGGNTGTGAGSATPAGTGSGSGAGSATPPAGAGSGAGSAATPPAPPAPKPQVLPGMGGGSGGASPPTGGTLQSPVAAKTSAEPEPAWSKP